MDHLEGRQSVLAALHARRRRFELVLIKHGLHEERYTEVADLAGQLGVPVKFVSAKDLDALAHGSSHGGIIALCSANPRTTEAELEELLDHLKAPPLLLLLEGIDDARNLGFILRSAESMGAHAVLIKKHLWDFDPVEVARPSSGAYERVPLVQFEDVALLGRLRRRGLRLYGCVPTAKTTMHHADLVRPTLLALGGEKRGLSAAVRKECDRFIRIPTVGGPSSLSLSHAAAMVLAEAYRQRLS